MDTGGSNIQFAVRPDDGRMVVIEMNPRVSRSPALTSKGACAGFVRRFQRFHNEHRPHEGIRNRVPDAIRTGELDPEAANEPVGKVHCDEFLGGLLRSYRRAVA